MVDDLHWDRGAIAIAAIHWPAFLVVPGLVDKQRVVGVERHVLGVDLVEPRLGREDGGRGIGEVVQSLEPWKGGSQVWALGTMPQSVRI